MQLLDDLIVQITRRLQHELGQTDAAMPVPQIRPRLLVLFTCGAEDMMEQAAVQIAHIHRRFAEVSIALSETTHRCVGSDFFRDRIGNIGIFHAHSGIVPAKFMRRFELVLLPTLTQNTAVKIAQLLRGSFASNLAAEAILAGLPILAATDAILASDVMPPAYRNALTTVLQQLSSYQIQLTSLAELGGEAERLLATKHDSELPPGQKIGKNSQDPLKRQLLTAVDVEKLARTGERHIHSHAYRLITPLARDRAKELGLRLQE